MQTPIIQFGTSRFLQAHVDLFVSEALDVEQAIGPITVVKSTNGAERSQRLAGLTMEGGFPVIIRGIDGGHRVDREQRVHSVQRALCASDDWPIVERIFVEEVAFVVSNTGDQGYTVPDADRNNKGGMSVSFPGRLLDLLHQRYLVNARPLTIMPCELVSRNGEVLRDMVVELAETRRLEERFIRWLTENVIWACSVVDRIASEPIEPAGAVAEPYALWAVESQPGLTLPCVHPAVQLVESLEPVERLKLHILNLGHTLLTHWWLRDRQPDDQTVRGILQNDAIRSELEAVYHNEVLPGFAAHGMNKDAEDYVLTTRDRFDNPYLRHRLQDIAANHAAKVERRIAAFIHWANSKGDSAPKPVLQSVCEEAERNSAP